MYPECNWDEILKGREKFIIVTDFSFKLHSNVLGVGKGVDAR